MGLESFHKAAGLPEWLEFIGEMFRLGLGTAGTRLKGY